MKILTKDQYDNLDVPVLFSEEYSRGYGSIIIDTRIYKFSWQSTLIEPQIKYLKPGVIGIGIDQHFCLLDSSSGKYLTLPLVSNFYYMKTIENRTFVICEIEIQIVNLDTLGPEKTFLFDEIIKDVNITGQFMTVTFLNDESIKIDLNTKTTYDC